MTRHPSAKLAAYASLAGLFIVGAQATSRPELVALAAPFVLVLLVGLASSASPEWSHLSVSVDRDRVVEGETVDVRIELAAVSDVARLEVLLPLAAGLLAENGASLRAVDLLAGEHVRLVFTIRCERWGVYELGEVFLRAHDRYDLFRFDGRFGAGRPIKVYPRTDTLRMLASPSQTRIHTGSQVSRRAGEGIEFTGVRPLVPGDRARSIDWKISARKGSPWVREHLPERNTDVIVFMDTFSDVWLGAGSSSLEQAVRAAVTITAGYLARRDRVGMVSFGGILRWLQPGAGVRQQYRIVDALLDTEIVVSYAWKGIDVIPVRTLPPSSLVLAVTPLLDGRSIAALFDLRARGFDVAVIEISPRPTLPEREDAIAGLTARVWMLERQMLRRRLRGMGVAVAEWREGEPIQRPLMEVEAFRRRTRVAHV